VFLFGLTRAAAAQPRALFGGHLGTALIGIACFQIFGDALWVYGLAEVLALWYMLLARAGHPPAGANPLIMIHYHADFPSLLGTVVMLIVCAPFASKLAAKFGKKELAVASSICSALVWLVCLIWRPASVWGFVACYILANIGMGFFNTIIWAMITDVIDDAEVRSGIREDGTIYSVYSFARKLGQAFSSGLVGALLGIIGYTEATAFDPAVTRGIFNMACIAPIIGFVCIVLALVFLYPLNKKKVEENVAALAARRNNK
jgi:Na+/melibiose symporter-like transporter